MEKNKPDQISREEQQAPKYEPPKVISLSKDEILEELGPARAVYGTLVNGAGC
jgi:hypothetical protein